MKTVSLELSKQLKANGYPQEGSFRYWGVMTSIKKEIMEEYRRRFNDYPTSAIWYEPILDFLSQAIERVEKEVREEEGRMKIEHTMILEFKNGGRAVIELEKRVNKRVLIFKDKVKFKKFFELKDKSFSFFREI